MAELQLDPQKKTALIVIDLQNAIVGMNPVPHTAAQVVENSKKLADAFRGQGAPVVYVRVDLNDFMHLPVDKPHNLGDKPMPAEASEIAPSAGFLPGDILVTKRHWGAFAGTDLEQQLKSRGIDSVVLTGISTNAGVESTARQGTGLGFAFVLVEDACSSQNAEHHRFAFEHIFPASHTRPYHRGGSGRPSSKSSSESSGLPTHTGLEDPATVAASALFLRQLGCDHRQCVALQSRRGSAQQPHGDSMGHQRLSSGARSYVLPLNGWLVERIAEPNHSTSGVFFGLHSPPP